MGYLEGGVGYPEGVWGILRWGVGYLEGVSGILRWVCGFSRCWYKAPGCLCH